MKKTILFLALFGMAFLGSRAQVVTPNTGVKWNLDSLVANFPSAFSLDTGLYSLENEDLLVSKEDTLILEGNLTWIVDSGVQITVEGSFISRGDSSASQPIIITAFDTVASRAFHGFRFEDSSYVSIYNTSISRGGGLRVLTEHFYMDKCFVQHTHSGVSSTAVIGFSRGKPIVKNSYFVYNETSAIGSGANQAVSAIIENNTMAYNNLGNSNRPQINLGPTHSDDTTYILNNTIIGDTTLTKVGGASVSSLLGGASVHVVFRDNNVVNNRYGLNLQGVTHAIVEDNRFIENDSETNPLVGGSGISVSSNDGPVIASGNVIAGNLWGITLLNDATINLGDTSAGNYNRGENIFSDNGNGGITYALYNNTPNTIMAMNNCWTGDSTATLADAEDVIFHLTDDATLGEVLYDPIWDCLEDVSTEENRTQELLEVYPNPTNGYIHVNVSQPALLDIFSLSGKKVGQYKLEAGNNHFNPDLERGVYILKAIEGNTVRTQKLIVE